MVAAGADVLDVGGMTAQPGEPIPADAEIERVVPVVRGLRELVDVPISIDTYRAEVADAALAAGADLVNDHTGLSDPHLLEVVAGHGAGLVLTHLGLAPKQEQDGRYTAAFDDITDALASLAARATGAGVRREAILVDPGLGFGKDTDTDLETLRRLPELRALGYPVLLAPSHKEVTAEPLGLPEDAIEGTAAVVAVAAYLGVDVLRLHDLPFMAPRRPHGLAHLRPAIRPGPRGPGRRTTAGTARRGRSARRRPGSRRPTRRSQTMSQWSPDTLVLPVSG